MEKRLGPEIVGEWVLGELLGQGGMGTVHQARHLYDGREGALKRPNGTCEQSLRRMSIEIAATKALPKDENLIAWLDSGRDKGVPFLVTERLRGERLADRIARGAIPYREWLCMLRGMLRGLHRVSGEGGAPCIVHRDIKPSNVYLCWQRDGSVTVVLIDFGIGKLEGVDAKTRERGLFLGSWPWCAPEHSPHNEHFKRSPTPASDIYAVATVSCDALSGRDLEGFTLDPSTTDRSPETLLRELPPDVPVELRALLKWMLSSHPDHRPKACKALLEVERLIARVHAESAETDARSVLPPPPPPPPPSRAAMIMNALMLGPLFAALVLVARPVVAASGPESIRSLAAAMQPHHVDVCAACIALATAALYVLQAWHQKKYRR